MLPLTIGQMVYSPRYGDGHTRLRKVIIRCSNVNNTVRSFIMIYEQALWSQFNNLHKVSIKLSSFIMNTICDPLNVHRIEPDCICVYLFPQVSIFGL